MPGAWRIAFDAAYGQVRSSHVATCPDVAPECATTPIPPHEHHVTVGLTHSEIGAEYGIRSGMELHLRLPYDVKAERVRYTTLTGAQFVPPYGDIHHRTETLRGIGDPSLMLERTAGDSWIVGAGLSFPAGKTYPDPIAAGRLGITHEHLEFGAGTVQPRISAQWSNLRWFARGEAAITAYESSRGYRAPSTLLFSGGPSLRISTVTIDPRLEGQFQTRAYWHGAPDEDSGYRTAGIRVQVSIPAGRATVAPSVWHELASHASSGESFHQGTTWALAVVLSF